MAVEQMTLDIPPTVCRPDTKAEKKRLARLRRVPASFKTKKPTSRELERAGVKPKVHISMEALGELIERAAQSRERTLRMAEECLRKGRADR